MSGCAAVRDAWAVIHDGDVYYEDGVDMRACWLPGPECQGESSAEHLRHVFSSDRLSHSHTQQAPPWNSTVQLPRQHTGNTHTQCSVCFLVHTHINIIYIHALVQWIYVCVLIFSCGRGWFLGDSPAPTQPKSKSTHQISAVWNVLLLWCGVYWLSLLNVWVIVSVN